MNSFKFVAFFVSFFAGVVSQAAEQISDTLFDDYVMVSNVETQTPGLKYWVSRETPYAKMSKISEADSRVIAVFAFKDQQDEYKNTISEMRKNIPRWLKSLKQDLIQQASKTGEQVSVFTNHKEESLQEDEKFFITKIFVRDRNDQANTMVAIHYFKKMHGIGLMVTYRSWVKSSLELSSIKASLVKFSTKYMENLDKKQIYREIVKTPASSYWTPPLGMFRGVCTICFSPLNLLRSFWKAGEGHIKPFSLFSPLHYVVVAFYFIPCSIEMVGDIGLGMLDFISFGIWGNKFYSEKVTPWFWERNNIAPVCFEREEKF